MTVATEHERDIQDYIILLVSVQFIQFSSVAQSVRLFAMVIYTSFLLFVQ